MFVESTAKMELEGDIEPSHWKVGWLPPWKFILDGDTLEPEELCQTEIITQPKTSDQKHIYTVYQFVFLFHHQPIQF